MTLFRTRLIVGESVQPRYILPLMPMLLAILLVDRVGDRVVRLSRVQSVLIVLALTVATMAAVYANIRRYVTGVDGPTMIDDLEWWWQSAPSPDVVTLVAGLSFAVFASPLIVMHWRRPVDDRPEGATVVQGSAAEPGPSALEQARGDRPGLRAAESPEVSPEASTGRDQ
jgi:hypothetical protein